MSNKKLKTVIEVVDKYSKPGDKILDPFSGRCVGIS